MTEDGITLLVNGWKYQGWTGFKAERALTQAASSFHLATALPGEADAKRIWPVEPFDAVQIFLGDDLLLTGHVDVVAPSYDHGSHTIQVSGRSRTADLVDCQSEVPGGEFRRSTLDAIARAVCAPFGIGVVTQAGMGDPFPIAALERTETVWQFLEKLARQRGLLLSDDGAGNLLLATVAETRASGALVQGLNLEAASATLDVSKRFSKYVLRSQTPIAAASDSLEDVQGEGPALPAGGGVGIGVHGEAVDLGVPRYRPHIANAEHALDQAGARERALWQASYAIGRAASMKCTVAGWRDDAGALWQANRLVAVKAPWLRLEQDLLIVGCAWNLDSKRGRTTDLTLGPVAGYTPDPGQVKRRTAAAGTPGANTWGDVRAAQ